MIEVEILKGLSVAEQRVEIVERKGIGHPDYICDSIMEAISVALSKEYMKEFGIILHHNVDKGFLVAGEVEKRFGEDSGQKGQKRGQATFLKKEIKQNC